MEISKFSVASHIKDSTHTHTHTDLYTLTDTLWLVVALGWIPFLIYTPSPTPIPCPFPSETEQQWVGVGSQPLWIGTPLQQWHTSSVVSASFYISRRDKLLPEIQHADCSCGGLCCVGYCHLFTVAFWTKQFFTVSAEWAYNASLRGSKYEWSRQLLVNCYKRNELASIRGSQKKKVTPSQQNDTHTIWTNTTPDFPRLNQWYCLQLLGLQYRNNCVAPTLAIRSQLPCNSMHQPITQGHK